MMQYADCTLLQKNCREKQNDLELNPASWSCQGNPAGWEGFTGKRCKLYNLWLFLRKNSFKELSNS